MSQPRIEKISVKHVYDENPNTSWLGEYSDICPSGDDLKRCNAFDRLQGQDNGFSREYRYFIPANRVEVVRKAYSKLGYSKQVAEELSRSHNREDYKRWETMFDSWHFVGIVVECTTVVECTIKYQCNGKSGNRMETFSSSGIWGIESDSDASYKAEIQNEQLDELKSHLEQFNVDVSNWDELVQDIEIEEGRIS